MTIDITKHLYAPAPFSAYDDLWQMATKLYPYRHNPAVMDALVIVLDLCMKLEDGRATMTNLADAESAYLDAQREAA